MLTIENLLSNEEIKQLTLTHFFSDEQFCLTKTDLCEFFNVEDLLISDTVTSEDFFRLALNLTNNARAQLVKQTIVDIALDLINLSTGGGSTVINGKQGSHGKDFEEIMKLNSDVLVRLKERE